MSFALYRRPGGVVFLDDDAAYLEMLADVLPPDWYVRLFLRPVECIAQLLEEPPRREADAWRQQEIVNRWRDGVALIPQILQYWREDKAARFALTRVCVVDYSMPAMSGLRVLSELTDWSGARILLTGRVDEQLAVSAFNRGLIEQFIPKQTPEIRLHLSQAIQSQLDLADERLQQTWRATLTREQHALLCEPAIAQALDQLSISQGWIEHVVLGWPFGVLALDRQGGASWLQLTLAEQLPALAAMAAALGWDAATVQDIRNGKRLLDLELQQALGEPHQAQARQAFAMAGPGATLYAALFTIAEPFGPGYALSYERFIATFGNRQLPD
ncbi:Response regulator receiver domain-containing protein [Polaromonas sp. OV174]|uniref:response regulator transcription factor n=1 Tax=Polaromonas sp. OV174 TaxID=1855300 RepID=UPI0008E5454B|nr:response regulator transcription factor [Polaromonas sp. OV174]SFC16506.1 Response regulator receiver domain-containing protein [Polaromonas sp. OV174]